MWFDEIMDDCKQALQIASKHKGIFVPLLVKGGIYVLTFIVLFITAVGLLVQYIGDFESIRAGLQDSWMLLVPAVLGAVTLYLFLTAIGTVIEVGSINLYKLAIDGIQPKIAYFFEGIRKYFFRVFGVTLLIHGIVLILLPLLLALAMVYAITIGILTAGWGFVLIAVLAGIYFNLWIIAVVVDDMRPLEAITTSIKIGRKYFWGMFILTLSGLMVGDYLVSAFGTLVTLTVGWFIGGVVVTYFKLVFVLVYRRQKEECTQVPSI